jgi:single-stranded-DNA-specific exonuclease
VGLAAVNEAVVEELQALSPHGEGNPEPLLCVPGVYIERAYPVGDGTHLKMTVFQDGCRSQAIAFGLAGALGRVCSAGSRVDLACTPVINEYRGRRSVELQVRAARLANVRIGER